MKLCKIIDNEVYDLVSLVSPDMLDNFFIVDFRDTERILNITYRVGIVDGVPETDEEETTESTVKRQGGILHTPGHEQTDGSKVDPKRKPILRT